MCTVSFLPKRTGFALAMNRDEQKSRLTGLPPERHLVSQQACLYPSELGGGTWIGLNHSALALALINWYEKPVSSSPGLLSRGIVVPSGLAARSLVSLKKIIRNLPLTRLNPFRLLCISLRERVVMEFRWDGHLLENRSHPWKRRHWFSSGYDETQAAAERAAVVIASAQKISQCSLTWLRDLHQSHQPKRGPFSICMHRDDAQTVSFTEIVATAHQAKMSYLAGSPCSNPAVVTHTLRFHGTTGDASCS